MSIRRILLAATIALAAAGAAKAESALPNEAKSIDLGAVTGVAYYTVEPEGFRVVATFAEGAKGTPVRVVSVLAPGQSVVLSAPGAAGQASFEVEISRQADAVLVRETAVATN